MNLNIILHDGSILPAEMVEMLPTDSICQATIDLAYQILQPAIYNHSLRVYFHAMNLLKKEERSGGKPASFFPAVPIDQTLLFVAALFHDSGTTSIYNGRQRFEVEGADAACSHMMSHGISSEVELQRVWSAIALHTSPGIAERIDPFTRILRIAVKIDFSKATQEKFGTGGYAIEIEKFLPRLEVERVLANAVVMQAGKILDDGTTIDSMTWPDSEKHPKASWPGILLRAHLENREYEGVNPAF